MSLDDPRSGAPSPLGRPQQPAPAPGRVENPASAERRPPTRIVPEGFSRTVDDEYVAAWGAPPPAPAGGAPVGGSMPWQPAPPPSRTRVPAAMPLRGLAYSQALRPLGRRVGRWFLAWAIAIGFFALGQTIALVLLLPTIFELFSDPSALLASGDPASLMADLMSSPWAFLGVNLSWAAMIPGAVVALAAYGDRAMGFAFSVAGRWRWRVVGRAALVVGPVFVVYIGLMLAIDPSIEWEWQPNWLLVAIVLLTTPLQASGEEFAFRGIVTQQLGSWIRSPLVSALVTGGAIGLVFGFAHIGYPPLAIAQVTLVGFTCAMLTFRTGGLEAACVLHTANNLFIMLPLALLGLSPFATSDGEGSIGTQLLGFAACVAALGISYVLVHRFLRGAQRRTDGDPAIDVLQAPRQQAPAMGGAQGWAGQAPYGVQPWQGGQPVFAQPQGGEPWQGRQAGAWQGQHADQPWQGWQGQPGHQQWHDQQGDQQWQGQQDGQQSHQQWHAQQGHQQWHGQQPWQGQGEQPWQDQHGVQPWQPPQEDRPWQQRSWAPGRSHGDGRTDPERGRDG